MNSIRIFTVASDESKLAGLYRSCELNGSSKNQIEVLSITKWRGFIDKIQVMKSCVENLDDDVIVCFIDAYDVLCLSGLEEICKKFLECKSDIVFSSELNCYPIENLSRYEMIEYNLSESYYENISNSDGIRPIETNYKYVNSGGYIGYAWAMKKMFSWKPMDEIERIIELGGDQNYFTQYYLEFADIGHDNMVISIDDQQRIFQSLYKVDLADFSFHRGRLYNHVLRTYPCFIHFNGYKDYGWTLRHIESGNVRNAMDIFLEKMEKSKTIGNCGMEYRLVPFYYAGMPQECIQQLILNRDRMFSYIFSR